MNEDIHLYYRGIEEKISFFVKELSGIKYLKGSSEVVSDGAYEWETLCPDGERIQHDLYQEYMSVTSLVRTKLEQMNSPYMEQYSQSCEYVADMIQQQSILFVEKIQDVADEIKRQIDIQLFLVMNHT
ncbi:hypothetical protein GRF59_01280 [Paenibacillus sp. HJL G12]|uniref:Uncharacterized protein n=1 Tax=Paenibacillus dendrobii TaxID=2691084 RepID=A0A7X3IE50_9BACL|nr:hypothetical protein [Paenibacillus dendrobii]MWV42249.1 hypothetical protein [Paenibacillus dendrobii]